MEKVVCCRVLNNLTEHQREERGRISKETVGLLNNGCHRNISKIVKSDKTYIQVFDVQTSQESKTWVFEDDTMPLMVKRQQAMKKSNVCRFLQNCGLGEDHQVRKTENSTSKPVCH
ncbi:uncharacterized protein TNCV_3722511 [Trichonephila clavipes]|nr:uncharacterized protein TNCV_3722511 [Trichonephila clavipes]